ncbi:MAG: low molecular weight protein arginine phosphatase [Undibacterium sp.]|nr:low molecular weight protein arginine phosphatase [Opitutaceae bacterium]
MPAPGYILVVCTANICRSPMAAALLKHALAAQPEPLRSLEIISAGVGGRDGDTVSPNSVTALKKVGLDISDHRSRAITEDLVTNAVAVLGMTESHRATLQFAITPVPRNIFLFREFMPQRGFKEIGDPYGGPLKLYESARDEMVEAIPTLIEFLKTRVAAEA